MSVDFHQWLLQNNIKLHDALEIHSVTCENDEERICRSIVVHDDVPPNVKVAQIPKLIVLSHRTSKAGALIHELLQSVPYTNALHQEVSPVLRLTVVLLHEILIGPASKWFPYLESLPSKTVPIASAWDQTGDAYRWAKGTELIKVVRNLDLSLPDLAEIYKDIVSLDVISKLQLARAKDVCTRPVSFELFWYCYSIVSSRAFQVDVYHTLGLVPLADLFNHSDYHQVHFESDNWVCSTCGSVNECSHDTDEKGEELEAQDLQGRRLGSDQSDTRSSITCSQTQSIPTSVDKSSKSFDMEVTESSDLEQGETCDLVSTRYIYSGEEVYNTYGPLSNAHLLAKFGFTVSGNQYETISFTVHDVVQGVATSVFGADRQVISSQDIDRTINKDWLKDMIRQEISMSEKIERGAGRSGSGNGTDLVTLSPRGEKSAFMNDDLLINSDGKVSMTLWLVIASLCANIESFLSSSASSSLSALNNEALVIPNMLYSILKIQQSLYESHGRQGDENSFEEKPLLPSEAGSKEFELAILMAKAIVQICRNRINTMHEPEMTASQLFELAETEEDKACTTAIEFTATERLLLECVIEYWSPMVDYSAHKQAPDDTRNK